MVIGAKLPSSHGLAAEPIVGRTGHNKASGLLLQHEGDTGARQQ